MAQDLTPFTPEVWAKDMQIFRKKKTVAYAVASVKHKKELFIGDTLNKPYMDYLRDQDYTKGTEVTVADLGGNNEYLSVNVAKVVPFYVDMVDKIQNKWKMQQMYANQAQQILSNRIDGALQDRYQDAEQYIDDGHVGGTAGNYIVMGTDNVAEIFTAAKAQLHYWDVDDSKLHAILGPRGIQYISDLLMGKDTAWGDKTGKQGFKGMFGGFKTHLSTNTPYSARIDFGTNPTATDTVVIAGVTFTFVAAVGATAGNVLIGNAAADSIDNLVAAINGASGAGTTYVALSSKNRRKINRCLITATDGTSYMTIAGYGEIVVSETLTASADVWSLQYQHLCFMQQGAVDIVVQKFPGVQVNKAQLMTGHYILCWTLFGIKTFQVGSEALIDVRIDASNWT